MTFDIRLSNEIPAELEGGPAVYGSIQIGGFTETFLAELSDWPPERYQRQWREAAKRLVVCQPRSAFVTSFLSPDKGLYFEWWPCYLVGETVYIQNQLRFYEQIPSPFITDTLYDYIPDRKTVSDDEGARISEWQLPLSWMKEFLRCTPSG